YRTISVKNQRLD
ncbi:hypothetical protein D030_1574B, partial [Vibrio parahaemolyticus AQ3810]